MNQSTPNGCDQAIDETNALEPTASTSTPMYLPGQYISKVKRPGVQYIYRGIIQEDFAFWILSTIALAAMPALHLLGMALLAISFWAIYERGYVDNDRAGAQFEKDPKLSQAFRNSPVATPTWQPWIWAAACGALGLLAVRWPQTPAGSDYLVWASLLIFLFYWYKIYNRVDKKTRVWMFLVLQIMRIASFVAIVPVTAAGSLALAAHALARWVPYCFYRSAGGKWADGDALTMRLVFFVVIGLFVGLTQGWAQFVDWSALALLLWCVFKARHEIKSIVHNAHRIDRQ